MPKVKTGLRIGGEVAVERGAATTGWHCLNYYIQM